MPPERLSPQQWLSRQPLEANEQLFAIFGDASDAAPFKAWRNTSPLNAPAPIWADTAYAEWEAVMPYVALVASGSAFLDWVAATESNDWGWLVVSCEPQKRLVEHLRGLTQVLLPDGSAVFFRFWDGRYLQPILHSAEVDAARLLPFARRCLINGQAVEIDAAVQGAAQAFPWWEVPAALLEQLAGHSDVAQVDNLLKWLSEDRPDLFEAFCEDVLRRKVEVFLKTPGLPATPKAALLQYLTTELPSL